MLDVRRLPLRRRRRVFGDVLSTLLAFPKLPKGGRWLVLLSAAGAAATARLASQYVDADDADTEVDLSAASVGAETG